jgi:hypothetical protein
VRWLRGWSEDMDTFAVFIVLWIFVLTTGGVVIGSVVVLVDSQYDFHTFSNDLQNQGYWVIAGALVVAARMLRPLAKNGNGKP